MPHVLVDGLPDLSDSGGASSLRTRGLSAFLRFPGFISKISLESSRVSWVFGRQPVEMSESTCNLPRRIHISDSDLWVSEADEVVAELSPTDDGGVVVSGRHA